MEQLPPEDRWFMIVNPVAGHGCGLTDFPQISKLLRDNCIPCNSVFTEHKYHATELTVAAVNDGYRRIIIVGGDGTLNEVVNGLFIQQVVPTAAVTLAVIAVGTGNDWIRTFGIPYHYSEAIRAIKEECTFLQDVGAITYTESQYKQTRYMVNVADIGFAAKVIKNYNHQRAKGRRGRWLYPINLLRTYFSYKSKGVKVTVDGLRIYNDLLFNLAVGICKYNGGGIQQLPQAVADDGLFDITIIKPIHWWHIIFRASRLFNGSIYTIGHILHFQGKTVRVYSSPESAIETDGEMLGTTPVEMSVVPKAISVVVSQSFVKN